MPSEGYLRKSERPTQVIGLPKLCVVCGKAGTKGNPVRVWSGFGLDPTHKGCIGLPKPVLTVECDQCGADVTEGIPHECPVGGNTVLIERKADEMDADTARQLEVLDDIEEANDNVTSYFNQWAPGVQLAWCEAIAKGIAELRAGLA